ncbi:hypothetical protein CHS0354_024706 [Potamilus streckersoni]|uniref:Rhodanese domain-containing protein n=1 Tax=Potamilus streckersoni TaxID=2493646 RepID=A0AAE0VK28_9BIVA|nr:hypothetical protein CHS0354_024706 [Potamilus streckersoni]
MNVRMHLRKLFHHSAQLQASLFLLNSNCRLGSISNCLQRLYCTRKTTEVVGEKSDVDSAKVSLDLPYQARVVICGGGVTGTSVAYHLASRGWNDVVLLEQGLRLACGTTWHAAGLVSILKADVMTSKLVKYSRSLYKQFEEEGKSEGSGIGWKTCGSLDLARTKDRMIELRRKKDKAIALDEECHMLLPKDIKKQCPWIKYDDLQGGMWRPHDGVVSPNELTETFARRAKEKGVKIFTGVQVKKVLIEENKVSQVETSCGPIKCEYFINCAGQWARELGKKSEPKVRVPLHSCEHFYVVTQPIEDMDKMLPVIRDFDGNVYLREWSGGILAGGFEPPSHGGKPVFYNGIPDKFEFQLLHEDWDHFQILLEEILFRMPILKDIQIRQLVNGPESFTPDKFGIIGESAEVQNYFVAAGMHSNGIANAGGVGKYLTEWIIDGMPSLDLWTSDIQRFVPYHNNRKFLRDRAKETIGFYHLTYPQEQWQSGRNLRTSPIHTQLKVAGASFGETNAYERAAWFNPTSADEYVDVTKQIRGTFGKPGWFDCVRDEYWACKERVALIDMSSFTKLEIKSQGPEALNFLQYVCSNNINEEEGTIIHTGMQNSHGGFENDCSVVPLQDNTFFLIAPTNQQTKCLAWLHKHMPKDGSVQVRDVTSMYSGLNLIGPHAEQLLSDVSDKPIDQVNFKPMTCKVIDVGYVSNVYAMRLTHSGEDGFVLYIPSEYALHVYEVLMKAGKDYGIRNAGYYSLRHLRIEKLFAYWGQDLTSHVTPFEAGREFRVDFRKNFIGKEALLKQRDEGICKKFAQFLLEDFDLESEVWPFCMEPIFRNGKYVGMTTSSGYGFTLDRFVCLGYVHHMDEKGEPKVTKHINEYVMDRNAKYEISIAGKKYLAKVGIYTPRMAYKSFQKPTFIPTPQKI